MRLSGHDLVCLSSVAWEDASGSPAHHLMGMLAEMNRILFVDPPGSWWPQRGECGPFGRSWVQKRAHNLYVLRSPSLCRPFGWLERWWLRRELRQACAGLGMESPILWLDPAYPDVLGLPGLLHESMRLVHHTSSHPLVDADLQLMAQADLAFVASRSAYAQGLSRLPELRLSPNGIDFAYFNRALLPETPVAPGLLPLRRPIVTYLGPLDETFNDAWWRQLAQRRPQWCFVTAGSGKRSPSDGENILHLGPLQRSEWLGILKATTVVAFPFRQGHRSVAALSVAEAFAAGSPVVTTESGEATGLVYQASEPRGFLRALDEAISPSATQALAERLAWAQHQTWEARCRQIEEAILNVLAVKTKPSSIPLLVERIVRQGV